MLRFSTSSAFRSAAWIGLAALVGSLASGVFSGVLHWQRSLFLVSYIAIGGIFLAFYFYREKVALHELTHRWRHGIIGGAAASVLLLGNILAQPASARPEGVELAAALVWVGVIYAHVVLHIAAVLRGMDTMLQLPPHYPG